MDAEGLKELGESIHDAMVELYRVGTADWSEDLGGGCAVGSWLLYEEARKRLNLDIEFHCNGGHAWNEFNGYIFDVTATQYGVFDKVYIISRANVDSVTNSFHRAMYLESKRRTIDNVNETWHKGQQPANFKLKWWTENKAEIIFKDRRFK